MEQSRVGTQSESTTTDAAADKRAELSEIISGVAELDASICSKPDLSAAYTYFGEELTLDICDASFELNRARRAFAVELESGASCADVACSLRELAERAEVFSELLRQHSNELNRAVEAFDLVERWQARKGLEMVPANAKRAGLVRDFAEMLSELDLEPEEQEKWGEKVLAAYKDLADEDSPALSADFDDFQLVKEVKDLELDTLAIAAATTNEQCNRERLIEAMVERARGFAFAHQQRSADAGEEPPLDNTEEPEQAAESAGSGRIAY